MPWHPDTRKVQPPLTFNTDCCTPINLEGDRAAICKEKIKKVCEQAKNLSLSHLTLRPRWLHLIIPRTERFSGATSIMEQQASTEKVNEGFYMLKTAWCCLTGGVKHKDLVLLLESIRYIGHDRESSVLLLRRGLHVCLGDWEEGKRSARGKMGRANRRREAFPSSHHSLRPRYFLIISTFFGILSGRAFAEESGESLITAPHDTAPTLSIGAKIFDR